tara:strand:- start:32 stop:262 length:231 start_codon:yes stop_codon:yes gene_type:complete
MKVLHITSVEEVYITYTAEVDFNNDLLDWAETECPSQIADLLLDADKETQERFGFIWNNEREFCESTEIEIELKEE